MSCLGKKNYNLCESFYSKIRFYLCLKVLFEMQQVIESTAKSVCFFLVKISQATFIFLMLTN